MKKLPPWQNKYEAAGGHLIARHVGKTQTELLNRVSTGNVKTASSFTDRATAEAITSKAIDANQSKINNYLSGSQKGYLEINYTKSWFSGFGKNGGTIIGGGKPGFEGGTKIPPIKVEVVRPDN